VGNALALIVLVVALCERLTAATSGCAAVSKGIGLVSAALVLGAGMIAHVALDRAAHLAPSDAAGAADLWVVLHAVRPGLGGGNELAGGVLIGSVSLAGSIGESLARPVAYLGVPTGPSGLATVVPSPDDVAGALGLGSIVWFLMIGALLAKEPRWTGI